MSHITAGAVHAFYLFDVAEAIDLAALRAQLGARAGVAQLQDKSPGPPRVRYFQPPVIVDGELKARKLMNLSLSCDHRVVDGWDAASFMQTLKGFIENPIRLLSA